MQLKQRHRESRQIIGDKFSSLQRSGDWQKGTTRLSATRQCFNVMVFECGDNTRDVEKNCLGQQGQTCSRIGATTLWVNKTKYYNRRVFLRVGSYPLLTSYCAVQSYVLSMSTANRFCAPGYKHKVVLDS